MYDFGDLCKFIDGEVGNDGNTTYIKVPNQILFITCTILLS